MIDEMKKANPDIIIIMHSDGAVAPLIDDFIELGVDVYNPVQPNVAGSDPQELKDRYGDRICFFGGIDQQELLPSGDIKRIREAHILQPDVSMESIEEMIRAAVEFGSY
jgi:uroporphyrinogen decarboxylase